MDFHGERTESAHLLVEFQGIGALAKRKRAGSGQAGSRSLVRSLHTPQPPIRGVVKLRKLRSCSSVKRVPELPRVSSVPGYGTQMAVRMGKTLPRSRFERLE